MYGCDIWSGGTIHGMTDLCKSVRGIGGNYSLIFSSKMNLPNHLEVEYSVALDMYVAIYNIYIHSPAHFQYVYSMDSSEDSES